MHLTTYWLELTLDVKQTFLHEIQIVSHWWACGFPDNASEQSKLFFQGLCLDTTVEIQACKDLLETYRIFCILPLHPLFFQRFDPFLCAITQGMRKSSNITIITPNHFYTRVIGVRMEKYKYCLSFKICWQNLLSFCCHSADVHYINVL